jgi:hypothetical protein
MKRIIETDESEGFDALLGARVTLFCMNYIYTGKLAGVAEDHLLLEEAAIVYETGAFSDTKWKDAQPLPHAWRVQISAVESWGVIK